MQGREAVGALVLSPHVTARCAGQSDLGRGVLLAHGRAAAVRKRKFSSLKREKNPNCTHKLEF